MISRNEAIELAAKLLKISVEEAEEYCSDIEGLTALYFSVPIKGGDSLIVSLDGDVLYANSAVPYDVHIIEFNKGTRTPLDAFNREQ